MEYPLFVGSSELRNLPAQMGVKIIGWCVARFAAPRKQRKRNVGKRTLGATLNLFSYGTLPGKPRLRSAFTRGCEYSHFAAQQGFALTIFHT